MNKFQLVQDQSLKVDPSEQSCSCCSPVLSAEVAKPEITSEVPVWMGLAAATAAYLASFAIELFLGKTIILDGFNLLLYLTSGWPVLRTAFSDFRNRSFFDENFLMAVATLAAWVVGAGTEAVAVILFYQWGEYLQERTSEKSKKSLNALLASKPRTARVWKDGWIECVPEDVAVDDVFEVRAGEMVPVDGIVTEGSGELDGSSLTGESLPVAVEVGMEAQAGTMNLSGRLLLRAVRPYALTAYAGIVESVREALAKKAPLERNLSRFARIYTPLVLVAAGLLFGSLILLGIEWKDALYRSLVLLVISCPCALVISVPLTYLASLGVASRKGILVRDSGVFDQLHGIGAVFWDKTGTLTEGRPRLSRLVPERSEESLIRWVNAGFSFSNHPLARSWASSSFVKPSTGEVTQVREVSGQGVLFSLDGEPGGIGRASFLRSQGFAVSNQSSTTTAVYASSMSGSWGSVEFSDTLKSDAGKAIATLRNGGRDQTLLSGDGIAPVSQVATELDLKFVAELKPAEKAEYVVEAERSGKRVLFVGDGLNDAPILARAHVGVSLGAEASAAAMETADVVVLDSSPLRIVDLFELGSKTRVILIQNLILILGLKTLLMTLGGMGLAGLWEAVFGDVGVALLAIANTLRLTRGNSKSH